MKSLLLIFLLALAVSTLESSSSARSPKVWISIALCLDHTTKLHGFLKGNFSYAEAAYWGTKLWRDITHASVILTVVTKNREWENHPTISNLKEAGAVINYKNVTGNDVKYGCVVNAQIARMMAFQHSAVEDEDIIVASDADSFPMNASVLDPLTDHPSVDAWVWQYFHAEATGLTFPLSFIALKAKKWREVLGNKTISEWDRVSNIFGACMPGAGARVPQHPNCLWYLDQRMITRGLLLNKICSVEHPLVWKRTNLRKAAFNDSATCWHGDISNGHTGFKHPNSSWIHLDYTYSKERIGERARGILQLAERKG